MAYKMNLYENDLCTLVPWSLTFFKHKLSTTIIKDSIDIPYKLVAIISNALIYIRDYDLEKILALLYFKDYDVWCSLILRTLGAGPIVSNS